jgi:hypothetical protein
MLAVCAAVSEAQDVEAMVHAPPFVISGSVTADASWLAQASAETDQSPLGWVLTAQPTVSVFGLSFPFTFTISEKERKFLQPFNQLGLSPSFRWATAHIGFRNMAFSPYTLAGHEFLGGGIDLRPGLFRFAAMWGRLKRAVAEDTLRDTADAAARLAAPAFERMGQGVKLGVGSSTNYVDLMWFRGRDRLNSIPYVPVKTEALPGDNTVIGLSGAQRFFNVLTWDFDAAASHYTRDIRADTLRISNALLRNITYALNTRLSTQFYTAVQTGVGLDVGPVGLRADYKRVDPDYQSMGAYSSANDVSSVTVSPSLRLFNQAVSLTGSVGSSVDNLGETRLTTTRRFDVAGNLSVNPFSWGGLAVQYSRNSADQQSLLDSTPEGRVRYTVNSLTLTPQVTLSGASASHSAMLTYSTQWQQNQSQSMQGYEAPTTQTASLGYQLSLLSSGLSLGPNVDFSRTAGQDFASTTAGGSLSAGMSFFGGALSTGLAPTVSWSSSSSTGTSLSGGAGVNLGYTFLVQHSLRGGALYHADLTRSAGVPAASQLQFSAGYSFSF